MNIGVHCPTKIHTPAIMEGKPALEHALFKMRQGMVSPFDIEDSFGPLILRKKMLQQIQDERQKQKRV